MRTCIYIIYSLLILAFFSPLIVSAQEAEHSPIPDYRGDLGAEILGGSLGLIGGLGTGAIALAIGSLTLDCGEDSDFCGLGAAFIAGGIATAATLFMIPAGTTIAGKASEGKGSFWMALLGTTTVAVPSAAILIGTRPEDEVLFSALGAMAVGLVAGSIVGYRWSAPDTPQFSLVPVRDGKSVLLTVSGRFRGMI